MIFWGVDGRFRARDLVRFLACRQENIQAPGALKKVVPMAIVTGSFRAVSLGEIVKIGPICRCEYLLISTQAAQMLIRVRAGV
jgi:hypothetical protein